MKFQLSPQVTIEARCTDDFLSLLTDEERDDFYQCLACQDIVVKHVADQIIDGWTENGSYGSKTCGASITPTCELDIASRRIAEASSDIAKSEIDALKREMARVQKRLDQANDELHRMGR